MHSCPFSEFGRFWEDNGGESGRAADCRGFRWANTISGMMAICLGGKKKRKTGQEVNDIINLNISAACRISFVWSCLFVLITTVYGLVSKKNLETICSVEPNQFPHKPMIVDQEASHHRRANHTAPQHTLPYQTNDTLTIDMPYHTNATQCHALPRHAIPHCTKIKVPLPPCFFSQEEFLSLPYLLCVTSWFVPL